MSLTPILLGLGSNADREQHLWAGLDALSVLLPGLKCSPVFESEPVGIKSGPFLNLVVLTQTPMSLAELDRQLKSIEADSGRYAPGRKDLPLDIDILLYGDRVGVFDGLLLPREELLHNVFVLWPLALLVPNWVHPRAGRTFAELWRSARIEQSLRPVAFSWRGTELTPAALLEQFSSAHHGKKPD